MNQLDVAALRALPKATRGSQKRKLTADQRLAAYAFAMEGVPVKLIAKVFGVLPNAVYYFVNNDTTAAHDNVAMRYNAIGKQRVMKEIVTKDQMDAINEAMRKEASPW